MVSIKEKIKNANCNVGANNPSYIIIHETDNISKGAGASAHASAQYNGNIGKASVHYYVDDKEIYKCLDHSSGSWNCGDGQGRNGIHNNNTISIEICVNPDSNYDTAVSNCIDLVRYLKNGYYKNCKVVRHYDASGKWCPRKILDNNYWNTFLNRVEGKEVNNMGIPNKELKPDYYALQDSAIYGQDGKYIGMIYENEQFKLNWVGDDYRKSVDFEGQSGYIKSGIMSASDKICKIGQEPPKETPVDPKPEPPKEEKNYRVVITCKDKIEAELIKGSLSTAKVEEY